MTSGVGAAVWPRLDPASSLCGSAGPLARRARLTAGEVLRYLPACSRNVRRFLPRSNFSWRPLDQGVVQRGNYPLAMPPFHGEQVTWPRVGSSGGKYMNAG